MTADDRLVVLTVGTDSHPYDRAVEWVDAWAAANPTVRVVAQWGTSRAPVHATGAPLLPRPELDQLLTEADAVVSHGGPATLHQIRSVGLLPLCAPRDPALGEHVDDHQQRFARHQAGHGRVVHVRSREQLYTCLDEVLDDPLTYRIDPTTDAEGAARATARFAAYVDALLEDDVHRLDELHDRALQPTDDLDQDPT